MQMILIRMPAQTRKMQSAMDQVSQSCDNYDFTISTKGVHQPAPGKRYNEPTNTVNGQKLKVVDKFTYILVPDQCKLMMRSLPELQKPLRHTEESMQMSGSEMESSLTPS